MRTELKGGSMTGEKNPQWKGDNVGNKALHDWVVIHKPKSELCEICEQRKPQDLASIGHTYTRNLDEWRWLCRSCHMKVDIINGDRKLRDYTGDRKTHCPKCGKFGATSGSGYLCGCGAVWGSGQIPDAIPEDARLTDEELIELVAQKLCDKQHPMAEDRAEQSFWIAVAPEPYKNIFRAVAKEIIPIIRKQARRELMAEVESKWGWLTGKWKDPDSIMSVRYRDWEALRVKPVEGEQQG